MESHLVLKGSVFCLMIWLAACHPQYNYQVGSSYKPGLTQSSSGINGRIQIVPSQPLSQSYIPPASSYIPPAPPAPPAPPGRIYNDISQLPLQTQSSFNSVSSLNRPLQGFSSHSSNLNPQTFLPARKTIITKDIYVHTAPQEADDEYDLSRQLESIPIRKNYRIIFIKAPSQNVRVATEALKQAQGLSEERTVIYVLSKKGDVSDIQKQLNQVQGTQTVNRKPEVYFIKYKTNEEAVRAQQQIQAQYDALGGSTNISDEGFAPVTSVVGSLGRENLSTSGSSLPGPINSPSKTYLPPSNK